MTTYLWLLRHGRPSGQGNDAALLPEGEQDIAALGRRLAREGHKPGTAFCSPLRRAQETMNILLGELGITLPVKTLRKLQPETPPMDALDAMFSVGITDGRVLVVSHLPLLAHLALGFTGETLDFHPGTFVEIELDAEKLGGVLLRTIHPGDPEP